MKFAMNGALTIGTLDGANVEIREQVGAENFFLFGHTADQLVTLDQQGYRPWEVIPAEPELGEVLRLIEQGHFSQGGWGAVPPPAAEPHRLRPLLRVGRLCRIPQGPVCGQCRLGQSGPLEQDVRAQYSPYGLLLLGPLHR